MTYYQTLYADTALAEKTHEHLDPVTGGIWTSGKPVTQGVDKRKNPQRNTGYHGTHHAVYQEGPGLPKVNEDVTNFLKGSLQVSDSLSVVEEVPVPILKDAPTQSIAHVISIRLEFRHGRHTVGITTASASIRYLSL